jgi:hypothetical protein
MPRAIRNAAVVAAAVALCLTGAACTDDPPPPPVDTSSVEAPAPYPGAGYPGAYPPGAHRPCATCMPYTGRLDPPRPGGPAYNQPNPKGAGGYPFGG